MTNEEPLKTGQWRPSLTPELATNILILLTIVTLYLQLQGTENANLQGVQESVREIREIIATSDNNRQADTRAINARVDVVEQLILASHPAMQSPPVGQP